MTANQLAYLNYKENAEHNDVLEGLQERGIRETERSNAARELETNRSNQANERIKQGELDLRTNADQRAEVEHKLNTATTGVKWVDTLLNVVDKVVDIGDKVP